ncbi:Na+/H+ antiporter subunit E [Salimicrobium jeotgali]|uniref:Monovalent cation/H+ antiporter subunit E n=2 Tax=Salimicrobium TaxID=351195 RepID=K2H976_9BACI|nr:MULTISPECIES: Na+/H+ antiporter subunit E [Salimicrobium]AKG04253.1 Na+/H+ antiporter subunit E [Salimicrobium jeotgali]EKE32220.1 monovalent cation/H+ antiporter subunit E [Salimicrobium jeotgali]MBM7695831.1 multicomponent Na+:H+ antiporter subunit E [Salimicrobium jeotgali]SIS51849.1 multisubunit sodium/proton antiporter, MrpE subunit [Salimicrobium salexigens]
MPFQIVLNIIIAVMWMFLSETYNFSTFAVGYILGIFLLFIMRRFVKRPFYLNRVWKVSLLILLFIRELIMSSIDIVEFVYKKELDNRPGIFALPLEVKSDWEVTLLANLISLTPGTLSLAVSDNHDVLYIHAMDIPDIETSISDIKDTFEKAIMEVTR